MKKEDFSWRILEATVVALFWLQAARVLFSVLFGVIYDALFDSEVSFTVVGVIFAAVLVALLLPAAADRRRMSARQEQIWMLMAVLVTAAARVPLTINNPQYRLVGSIVVLGSAGFYLGMLLQRRAQVVPLALGFALVGDQLTRAYGNTWDITLQPAFLPLQIAFCLGLVAVAWTAFGGRSDPEGDTAAQLGFPGGVALGAFLFVQTAVLAQPNVLARWSDTPYEWAALGVLVITAGPLLAVELGAVPVYGGRPLHWLARQGVLARGGLLLLAAVLGLLVGRTAGGVVALAALLVAQLSLMAALPLLLTWPSTAGQRRGGLALGVGLVVFLILHLLYAFAFTYPYTVSALRGAGIWFVLVGVVVSVAPAVFRPPEMTPRPRVPVNNHLVVLFSLALLVVYIKADPGQPAASVLPEQSLRVATYNIHYGYDTDWHHTLEEQARTILDSGADVVVMQEVDAGRITSYGVDNAFWLARRLGMSAVFAPALEGLSGIALLTRLPILESGWELLPSELEQTALVHARLRWAAGELDAYGVWLGLEEQERLNQVSAALAYIGGATPAVFGGDMNSKPDSAVYQAVQAAGFEDPFVETVNLPAFSDPAVNPSKRIDFVWARGLRPTRAAVSPSLASDHRLVVVELALP